MKQKWDERYADPEFAYGKAPNSFFKNQLAEFEGGKILMPADGEGRNGVYAAKVGWQVVSFDISTEGKTKALQLADEQGVEIDYILGDLQDLNFEPESFDVIGLIYAHFSAGAKSGFHKKLTGFLKPGGTIILEAFSKNHIEYRKRDPKVGGPDDIGMLYSKEEILADFEDYEITMLEEAVISLDEGKYHIGDGAVIRFVARKNSPSLHI